MHRQIIGSVEGRVNEFAAFTEKIQDSLGALVDSNNRTAVEIILTILECLLADIANGKGKFEGLDLDGRQEAVNRTLDLAVKNLRVVLDAPARLAVCLAIPSLGSGMRSRLEIAA